MLEYYYKKQGDGKMKKLISFLLTITMVVSFITIDNSSVKTTSAKDTDWKNTAIKTPSEGQLVGAGYVNIEFDTSLEDAISYKVYYNGSNTNQLIDGTSAVMTFAADDTKSSQTCEVYSVDVKGAHTVYVVAELTDGSTVTSDTRTFYLSKKGLAMGGDMSTTVVTKKLNISWYYNWATQAFNTTVDEGVAHVPMVWGAAQENLQGIKDITDDSNYILGYNEPDIESQANLSAGKALAAWKYIEETGKRTVSPALAVYSGGFMEDFLINGATYDPTIEVEPETTTAEGETVTEYENPIVLEGGFYAAVDVDAVALHRYGGAKTGSEIDVKRLTDAIDWLWNKYHKPIWVTEVSVTGVKGGYSDWSYQQPGALELMKKYVKAVMEAMDADDRVERYCWFPYNVESANEIDGLNGCGTTALFDYETGKFTELGVMYSELGNPEGYTPYVISENEKFVWGENDEETTTVKETTTKNEITTTIAKETTKASIEKPAKVKIKSAKNNKKKAVTLKWTKAKNAKKYQVQYSLHKKFKKNKKYKTKTITVRKLSYTAKKLKNKKYYFRVRGVKGKVYGAWSKVKAVKVKK